MSRITVIIGYVASQLLMYSLGQGVVEKFTKLSKIAVKHSMECFTADFLRFFTEKPQKLVLLGRLCTGDQKSKHFRDFLEIPLLPTIQSYLVTRELTRTFTFWT